MKISFNNSYWVGINKDGEGNYYLIFQDGNGNLIEVCFERGWLSKRWFKEMIKSLNEEAKRK